VRMRRPLIYQEIGPRATSHRGWLRAGRRSRSLPGRRARRAPPTDHRPVLGYSSILSGSSDDQGFGIAVDSAGKRLCHRHHHLFRLPVRWSPCRRPAPVRATRS
jgi:hypothetical protein